MKVEPCRCGLGSLSPVVGEGEDAMDALGETALKLCATAMLAADAGSAHRLDDAAGPGFVLPW